MNLPQITMMAVAAAEEEAAGGGHGEVRACPPSRVPAWTVGHQRPHLQRLGRHAVLVVISFLATRNMQLVPSGLQNFVEVIVEALMGLIHQTAGPKGRAFAPVVMTAFLFILTANWLGTMPFFENIQWLTRPITPRPHCSSRQIAP